MLMHAAGGGRFATFDAVLKVIGAHFSAKEVREDKAMCVIISVIIMSPSPQPKPGRSMTRFKYFAPDGVFVRTAYQTVPWRCLS